MSEIAQLQRQLRKQKRRSLRIQHHRWAEGVLTGLLSQLRPDDVVIDCGANQGKVVAALAPSNARIVAFEPDPYAFGVLGGVAADLPNVELHDCAVGPEAARLTLFRAEGFDDDPHNKSLSSTLVEGGRGMTADGVEVEVIDLPARIEGLLAEGRHIAFLKIDIEGAEIDLVNALEDRGLLARIGFTAVETHEAKFPERAADFAALRARIAAAHPAHRVNLDWI